MLLLGVTYKRDVDDIRESAALEIIQLLEREGAQILYHDPFCPMIDAGGHAPAAILRSVDLTDELLERADAVVIVTDHSPIDYAWIARKAQLVIDTRGVMRGIDGTARVVGLSGPDGSRTRRDAAIDALA